jgi:type IX secretion system PorP/SprF family membrane protein
MKKYFTVIVLFLIPVFVKAQDSHFTQFFSSPLTLNPAYTGKIDGNVRFAGNFRNQWGQFSSGFKTYTASADFKITNDALAENDNVGIGILMLNDKSGTAGLKTNYFGLSAAYHKALDEEGFQYLSAGFQAAHVNKNLDYNKLVFENQLTNTGYDLGMSSNENNLSVNLKYWDVNVGLLYSNAPTENSNFYAGVSVYHVNNPKESFLLDDIKIPQRFTLHGGGYFALGGSTQFHFSGMYTKQANAAEFIAGGAFAFNANGDWQENPTNIYLGGWNRFGDAFSPYAALEFANIRIGYSYDINTSSLKTLSNGNGGNELSIIYSPKPNSNKNKGIPCPKF